METKSELKSVLEDLTDEQLLDLKDNGQEVNKLIEDEMRLRKIGKFVYDKTK